MEKASPQKKRLLHDPSSLSSLISVGDASGCLSVFEVGTGGLSGRIPCHEGPILSMVWNAADSQVLTGSSYDFLEINIPIPSRRLSLEDKDIYWHYLALARLS